MTTKQQAFDAITKSKLFDLTIGFMESMGYTTEGAYAFINTIGYTDNERKKKEYNEDNEKVIEGLRKFAKLYNEFKAEPKPAPKPSYNKPLKRLAFWYLNR